ncbi:hypothetical protein GOP47_0005919 [Adiantum capillus-veneris]|uniref:Uncharacterized protein n=1 Tax=Adiantum capillus-veneris TaxID=13818 RepID=A0A9D4ZJU7_ADICA|nr:hypothetical protein GOP47_0005919 [Adiantum capillus-veneris]
MNPAGSGSVPPPSSASASAGGVGRSLSSSSSSAALSSLQHAAEETLFAHLEDLTFSHDAKLETQRALMEELLESLRKEEKLLDADAWKYATPRSQLYLTSTSGVRLAKGELPAFGNKEVKGEQHLVG